MPNSLGLVSNRPPTKLCSVAINRPTTKLCSVAINRPPTKLCSVAILFRLGWSFRGSGLEFVYLGRFYLQYSLGSGVCSPGHVLFTIQSWVWSLFTWAPLIYNTVFSLEFVYLGMSYLQYSLGKKHKEESGHVQAMTQILSLLWFFMSMVYKHCALSTMKKYLATNVVKRGHGKKRTPLSFQM